MQQQLKRRDKKINNLESLLNKAKEFGDMTEETSSVMKKSFGKVPFELFVHQLQNSERKPQGHRYTTTMKEFALTLYFYSRRSYEFMRKKIHLPNLSSIKSWISSVDCHPGFLTESFDFLKGFTLKGSKFEDCALIIDGMAIRKQVIWDQRRNKYSGYVYLFDGKEDHLASEALVFLTVSLTHKFKCQVAYFLIDKLNTNVLSQLIHICIAKLHGISIRVWSILLQMDWPQISVHSNR